MKEYKVLAQSDSFWKDRFSPLGLENALNELARKGWRVITSTSTEFTGLGGLGTKRHELFFLLERDAVDTGQQAPGGTPSDDGYDASLIPADRFYKDVGNISTLLQNAGLVSKQQMNQAREQFARRGGHLADHLIAMGFIDSDTLRNALK